VERVEGKKGLTLIEVIVASTIFSILMFAILYATFLSSSYYKGHQKESRAQAEASFLMHHLSRYLSKAIAIDRPAKGNSTQDVQITIDNYTGSGYPSSFPASPVKVRYARINNTVQFGKDPSCPATVNLTETIVYNITEFNITRPSGDKGQGISFQVNITATDPQTGESFSLSSRITSRCMPWENP